MPPCVRSSMAMCSGRRRHEAGWMRPRRPAKGLPASPRNSPVPPWSANLLNKQIAYELSVSEATIKAHVTAIFRKLNVRTRTQAALLLQQLESISSH